MQKDKRIFEIQEFFRIPKHFNPGILGLIYNYPYLDKRYYVEALKKFSKINITAVIIFTDNRVQAEKHFRNYPVSVSNQSIDDFMKLCMCEHIIIDRSDYGKLAGILAYNPQKIIIQPIGK